MPADSLETWITRAFAVRCSNEDRRAIAIRCRDAQEQGAERNSVWHQAAIHFNYLDRCHCYPCSKERGER